MNDDELLRMTDLMQEHDQFTTALREAMNLKPDLAESDVIKAAKTLRHIYDQVLYTSSSHPFICGTIGDIGHNGLHDGYFICPAYGADVQCTEVYVKKSAIPQLSDS